MLPDIGASELKRCATPNGLARIALPQYAASFDRRTGHGLGMLKHDGCRAFSGRTDTNRMPGCREKESGSMLPVSYINAPRRFVGGMSNEI